MKGDVPVNVDVLINSSDSFVSSCTHSSAFQKSSNGIRWSILGNVFRTSGSLGYMNANMNDLVSEMTFSFAKRMIHEANISSSSGSMMRGILIILITSSNTTDVSRETCFLFNCI